VSRFGRPTDRRQHSSSFSRGNDRSKRSLALGIVELKFADGEWFSLRQVKPYVPGAKCCDIPCQLGDRDTKEFGGLVTQKEYENYYLRAEFKWGEKTYAPRDGKARDSGIQYNITGPLKVWPRMMEFQINEGGTGDMWVVGGTGVTVDGKVYESTSSGPGAYIRIPHIGRGPLVNVTGHRDPVNDLERLHGKWNVLELIVDHDRIIYFVNGKLSIVGTNANTTKGKILFQCEGSEVYFRKMKIAMLK
jgi:hypothetical protein